MAAFDAQAIAAQFTIPLVKIDAERRLVVGRAAQETPDRAKEIMDYETAKPEFQRWSDLCFQSSGGLSKGNVRVMHQKTVAGKLVDISFNDADKAIDVVAKIVDDNEWNKVLEGCYTGFSIGGGYGNRWTDAETGLRRYTPRLSELSLVDIPCVPSCQFADLVKVDGSVEQLQLRGVPERPRGFAEAWQGRPLSFAELVAGQHACMPASFAQLHKGFEEARHPRAADGKFSGGSEGGDKAAPAQPDDGSGERRSRFAGVVEGVKGGMLATSTGAAAVAAIAPKVHARAERNTTAYLMRTGLGDAVVRKPAKAAARQARAYALEGMEADDHLAESGKRKVMEEAQARGSSIEEAKAAGEKFAQTIRGRSKLVGELYENARPTIQVGRKASMMASADAARSIKVAVKQAHLLGAMAHSARSKLILGGIGAAVGGTLGFLSAQRLSREHDNKSVSSTLHALADAGDVVRGVGAVSGAVGLGSTLGSMGARTLGVQSPGLRTAIGQGIGAAAGALTSGAYLAQVKQERAKRAAAGV